MVILSARVGFLKTNQKNILETLLINYFNWVTIFFFRLYELLRNVNLFLDIKVHRIRREPWNYSKIWYLTQYLNIFVQISFTCDDFVSIVNFYNWIFFDNSNKLYKLFQIFVFPLKYNIKKINYNFFNVSINDYLMCVIVLFVFKIFHTIMHFGLNTFWSYYSL